MTRHRLLSVLLAVIFAITVGAVVYLETTSPTDAASAADASSPTDATPDSVSPPSTTIAPSTTVPPPPSTDATTTIPPSTVAPSTTAAPDATTPQLASASSLIPSSEVTATTSTSDTSSTETSSTVVAPPVSPYAMALPPTTSLPPTTTLPPPPREIVAVAVSSGSTTGERIGTAVILLRAGGWANIRGLNGSIPMIDSVVYYVDGFENAAEVMALDLSLPATATAPIAEAPPVPGVADAQLLVYLGGA